MKLFITSALIVALMMLIESCKDGNKKPQGEKLMDFKESIKVGMTYDEVEKILGKPKAIDRGVNALRTSEGKKVDEMSKEELEGELDELVAIRDYELRIKDSLFWARPKELYTIGQLIYVTWVFDVSRVDTFYTMRPIFSTGKDIVAWDKTFHVVHSLLSIVFDASSGRVVRSDFYPIAVSEGPIQRRNKPK